MQFRISSLNSSKTAHASFNLHAGSFFSKYKFILDARRDASTSSGEPSWTCGLQNRVPLQFDRQVAFADRYQALLSIFKRRLADSKDKDAGLERCEVELQARADQTRCRLLIRMICRHGVVKTYRLTYESTEVLHASFDKARSQNYWTISSRTLRDVVEYFGPQTEQLDWYFENGKVTFTSYTEKVQHGRGERCRLFAGYADTGKKS